MNIDRFAHREIFSAVAVLLFEKLECIKPGPRELDEKAQCTNGKLFTGQAAISRSSKPCASGNSPPTTADSPSK